MDAHLFDAVEAFVERHCGLDGPDAREAIRAIAQGETSHLPEAITADGQAVRSALLATLRASAVPVMTAAPVEGQAPAPTFTMSVESRRIAFRAVAGPRLEAMADALATSALHDEQALRAIETARQNLPSDRPRIPTIAERAAGQAEFGGDFMPPTGPRDNAAAGWRKAFDQTGGRL